LPREQGFYTYYHLSLLFYEVFQLLVAETKQYYNQYLGCSPLPHDFTGHVQLYGHNN